MPKSVFTARYKRFLDLLVEARTAAEVSQVELAARIGWQQTDISKVERGERRLDLIEFLAFAEALKIDAPAFVKRLQSGRK
ncbi:MAG: helix-turn-helix transcriptional regulator [Pirellulales bacterium]|nr:helix-turn-helix transcriptional regulator [Pirellulales bacterium]